MIKPKFIGAQLKSWLPRAQSVTGLLRARRGKGRAVSLLAAQGEGGEGERKEERVGGQFLDSPGRGRGRAVSLLAAQGEGGEG